MRRLAPARPAGAAPALAALALAYWCACGGSAAPPPSSPSALLARPLPDFRRPSLAGDDVATDRLRGEVVLVDFFAEDCPPCARSLPALEALHRARPGLRIVGVSEDEDAAGARRVVERFGLTFPVVHDAQHVLAGRYRVVDLPVTFVADGAGVVRWRGDGAHEEGEYGAVVDGVGH
jgi:cytochrome c biogenesis protein CcmG/thiol:disulfide interchange protein DsbE